MNFKNIFIVMIFVALFGVMTAFDFPKDSEDFFSVSVATVFALGEPGGGGLGEPGGGGGLGEPGGGGLGEPGGGGDGGCCDEPDPPAPGDDPNPDPNPDPKCEDPTAINFGGTLPCVHAPVFSCAADVTLNASPTILPFGGGDVTVSWSTTNVKSLAINRVSSTALSGSETVMTVNDSNFDMDVVFTDDTTSTCPLSVDVEDKPVDPQAPQCVSFTASPNSLPLGGGDVTLDWETKNADTVTIDNGVGTVSAIDNTIVSVANNITYTLTVEKTGFAPITCAAPIAVANPGGFSCSANLDSFTASPSSHGVGGGTSVLTWATTGVTSLSIDNGVTSTDVDGSESVNITDTSTFTMTIVNGTESDTCPLDVSVDTGGGGGSSLRCTLTADTTNINAGDDVLLTWDTRRATEITLTDEDGNVVVTSTDKIGREKKDLLDDEVKVNPTKDTEYTLRATRGSRERVCKVGINTGGITVLSERVAGISLTQIPYTGFEAGPALTMIFYTLLALWGAFVAYVLVIQKESVLGISFAGITQKKNTSATKDTVEMKPASAVVPSVMTPQVQTNTVSAVAPMNLPISPTEVPIEEEIIGYEQMAVDEDIDEDTDPKVYELSKLMQELENRAHERRALLSSDAIRYFIEYNKGDIERLVLLDRVIAEAKVTYPTEEGWVVINRERMEDICTCEKVLEFVGGKTAKEQKEEIEAKTPETITPKISEDKSIGVSSLAEAIVIGNISAAYLMLGDNPIFALTDAASDLDAVYRLRKGTIEGNQPMVSDMLRSATKSLSDTQLEDAIKAITSAIDGTYSDEGAAVKLAIMKAVKSVS